MSRVRGAPWCRADGTVVTLPADSPLRGGWQRTLQESSYLFNCLSYVVNRWQLDRRLRRAHEQAVVLAAAAEVEYKKKTESQPAANTVEAPTPAAAAVENKPAEPDHMPSVVDTPVSLPGDAAAQIVVTRHFLAAWKRDCDSRQARFIVAYVPGVAELEEGGNAAMAVSERALRLSLLFLRRFARDRRHRSATRNALGQAIGRDRSTAHPQ